MEDLDHNLNTTNVVAVGECGLDINKQLEYFEKQIFLVVKKSLPFVVHWRGDKHLDTQCLNSLTRILPKDFKIHRHCFNGKQDACYKWRAAFPYWKFGVSPCILLDETYPDF